VHIQPRAGVEVAAVLDEAIRAGANVSSLSAVAMPIKVWAMQWPRAAGAQHVAQKVREVDCRAAADGVASPFTYAIRCRDPPPLLLVRNAAEIMLAFLLLCRSRMIAPVPQP